MKREIVEKIVEGFPEEWIIVGSYRRMKEEVEDIDILCMNDIDVAVKIVENMGKIRGIYEIKEIKSEGEKQAIIIINYKNKIEIQIDLFRIKKENLPFALLHYTGNKNFNIRVRAHAKRNGYLLNQYGLYRNKDEKVKKKFKTEKDILDYIGVTYKEPSDRNE